MVSSHCISGQSSHITINMVGRGVGTSAFHLAQIAVLFLVVTYWKRRTSLWVSFSATQILTCVIEAIWAQLLNDQGSMISAQFRIKNRPLSRKYRHDARLIFFSLNLTKLDCEKLELVHVETTSPLFFRRHRHQSWNQLILAKLLFSLPRQWAKTIPLSFPFLSCFFLRGGGW